jgi:hypothetical protein
MTPEQFDFIRGQHTPGPFAYDPEGQDGCGLVIGGDAATAFYLRSDEGSIAEPSMDWNEGGPENAREFTAWVEKNVQRQYADGHLLADALTVLTHPGLRVLGCRMVVDGDAWVASVEINGEERAFGRDREIIDRAELLHIVAEAIRAAATQQADSRQMALDLGEVEVTQ